MMWLILIKLISLYLTIIFHQVWLELSRGLYSREESQTVDSLRDQKKNTRIIGSVRLKLKLNFLLELYLTLNSNLSTTASLSDPKGLQYKSDIKLVSTKIIQTVSSYHLEEKDTGVHGVINPQLGAIKKKYFQMLLIYFLGQGTLFIVNNVLSFC